VVLVDCHYSGNIIEYCILSFTQCLSTVLKNIQHTDCRSCNDDWGNDDIRLLDKFSVLYFLQFFDDVSWV